MLTLKVSYDNILLVSGVAKNACVGVIQQYDVLFALVANRFFFVLVANRFYMSECETL